jgi:hypothetical protein
MFAYVVCRAYRLSFTHDEAITHSIIRGDWPQMHTANHHPLNTWLIWLFSHAGNNEFVLRLPNVLAFVLYLVIVYRLFNPEKNTWLACLGISLLLLNPFLLEYFSLARGYGLSLGLSLASIYFLRRPEDARPAAFQRNAMLAVIFAAAALYANLSFFNFYVASLFILALRYVQRVPVPAFLTKGRWLAGLIIALAPLIWGVLALLSLKKQGQLYYGADTLSQTFASLIAGSGYSDSVRTDCGMVVFVGTVTVLIFCLLLLWRAKDYRSRLFTVAVLLSAVIAGSITEHILFGTKYPLERTALLLLPLLGLFFYYAIERLLCMVGRRNILYKGVPVFVSLVIIVPLLYNFAANANLTHTYTWKYDANTKDAAQVIKRYTGKQVGHQGLFTISNDWIFEPSLNYYIRTGRLPLHPANREGVNPNSDFVYTVSRDFDTAGFVLIDSFLPSGAKLYVHKSPNRF